jgi:IS5 family transposase
MSDEKTDDSKTTMTVDVDVVNDLIDRLDTIERAFRRVEANQLTGWVGAGLRLEETMRHLEGRRQDLFYSLGRHLYVATLPSTPEDERAALLSATLKYAAKVHERFAFDEDLRALAHADVLGEAIDAGAIEHEAYQRRVMRANDAQTARPAEARKLMLDHFAPEKGSDAG